MPRSKDEYPNNASAYPNAQSVSPVDIELSKLAPSRATVLLVGGSLELRLAAAVALHERSPRRGMPFVAFDCQRHPAAEVERDLFGGPAHARVQGGAVARVGSGTLYVGNIEELPILEQPRFLRYLDQERVARVVVSCRGELSAQVSLGKLRLDLAERLAAIELVLAEVDS